MRRVRKDDSIKAPRKLYDQEEQLSRMAIDLCESLTEQMEATKASAGCPKPPTTRRKAR